MKKIIHLSDTHIGDNDADKKMNKVVELILTWQNNASDYVIVHTGDVIADAKNGEYYNKPNDSSCEDKDKKKKKSALCYFSILKNAGFKNILFVPGNHDYGSGFHTISKEFVKKFDDFRLSFSEEQCKPYPIKTIIENIAFIGLDSLEGRWELGNSDITNDIHGKFGDRQLYGDEQSKGLRSILDSEDVKNCEYKVVYLHYHPTDFKPKVVKKLGLSFKSEIEDSDKFKEILQKHNTSALLFGHNHKDGNKDFNDIAEFEKCKEWGIGGIKRIYDGGSLKGDEIFLRVINLSEEKDEKWIYSKETSVWNNE